LLIMVEEDPASALDAKPTLDGLRISCGRNACSR